MYQRNVIFKSCLASNRPSSWQYCSLIYPTWVLIDWTEYKSLGEGKASEDNVDRATQCDVDLGTINHQCRVSLLRGARTRRPLSVIARERSNYHVSTYADAVALKYLQVDDVGDRPHSCPANWIMGRARRVMKIIIIVFDWKSRWLRIGAWVRCAPGTCCIISDVGIAYGRCIFMCISGQKVIKPVLSCKEPKARIIMS